MRRATLKLTVDTDAVTCGFRELSAALPEIAQRLPQVVDRLIELIEVGTELFVIERDRAATPFADEICMVAKPSQSLALLMAAVRGRAGEYDLALIEDALRHLQPPSVGCAPMLAESLPGEQPGRDEASPISREAQP
jgi:hypothetical protein